MQSEVPTVRYAVFALVPAVKTNALQRQGWKSAGRTNGRDETLYRIFLTEAEAITFGRKLPYIYSIEAFQP